MIAGVPDSLAQAVLTVDLQALRANWRLLRDKATPADCAAAVKANGYGLGLEQTISALSAEGCVSFFVAHPHEGERARRALQGSGRAGHIYVLNGMAGLTEAARACAQFDLIPVLNDRKEAELWLEQARMANRQLPAAIMFDTGMNRLGFDWRRAQDIAAWLRTALALRPVLIVSHFVASGLPEDSRNAQQIARLKHLRTHFPGLPASLANSSGLFLSQNPYFDQVRPGYALYGGNPTPGSKNPMHPVVSLKARILQLRDIEAGETVGYDAQWTAKRRTRLAAIGVGYADGLPRNAMATDQKNGGEAIVAGVCCPFAGRVSMDITMIDVTEVPEQNIQPGDSVELIGAEITVDDLAARAQTIGYEILTNLGRRYSWRYVGDDA